MTPVGIGANLTWQQQPIIGDSCQVNSPANLDSEVKRDTHDSSPFNAPINPHSQQSQRQSTNEVHGLNKEIIPLEAIKKNEIYAAFMDFKELLSWMIRMKQKKESFSIMVWIIGTHKI